MPVIVSGALYIFSLGTCRRPVSRVAVRQHNDQDKLDQREHKNDLRSRVCDRDYLARFRPSIESSCSSRREFLARA